MAVTSGFFNSISSDRTYDATQMSQLFEGIIRDGVFATVGNAFAVTASSGNNVIVGTGRAFFNNTWTNNDTSLTLTASAPHGSLTRIDAVVLEVNWGQAVRANSFKIISGTASANPVNPAMGSSSTMQQHPIAYIRRLPGAASIAQQYITYNVGQPSCPFVAGPLSVLTIDNWTSAMQDRFDNWFDALEGLLDGNAEANIAQNIINLQSELNSVKSENLAQGIAIQERVNAHTALSQSLAASTQARIAADNALNARVSALETGGAGASERMRTPRGNNLGSSLSATQMTRIRNGSFEEMWLGDYWFANSTRYRIVDFNYMLMQGNGHDYNVATKPHIVIMPDTLPITSRPHATAANTNGGYNGSPLQFDTATTIVNRALSDLKISSSGMALFSEYVTDGLSGGSQSTVLATARGWVPTHQQIFGVTPCADDLNCYGTAQFALFREAREFIRPSQYDYWLRSIQGSTSYWYVNSNGYHNARAANVLTRVRPYFIVA